jgi:hypothetical protein
VVVLEMEMAVEADVEFEESKVRENKSVQYRNSVQAQCSCNAEQGKGVLRLCCAE